MVRPPGPLQACCFGRSCPVARRQRLPLHRLQGWPHHGRLRRPLRRLLTGRPPSRRLLTLLPPLSPLVLRVTPCSTSGGTICLATSGACSKPWKVGAQHSTAQQGPVTTWRARLLAGPGDTLARSTASRVQRHPGAAVRAQHAQRALACHPRHQLDFFRLPTRILHRLLCVCVHPGPGRPHRHCRQPGPRLCAAAGPRAAAHRR